MSHFRKYKYKNDVDYRRHIKRAMLYFGFTQSPTYLPSRHSDWEQDMYFALLKAEQIKPVHLQAARLFHALHQIAPYKQEYEQAVWDNLFLAAENGELELYVEITIDML